MKHKKILEYFMIEGTPGGNQDWLIEWDMNRGGCAAVTACDLCMLLSRRERFRKLYPFDANHISRDDFIKFSAILKPFLFPRYHGVDFLETYICGLKDYMQSVKSNDLIIEGLSGNVSYEVFAEAIMNQIDDNFPVPFLLLNHYDSELEDFFWHWFNLAGYEENEENEDGLNVLTVTYGEYKWFPLRKLWDTHYKRKGGIIRVRCSLFNAL